MPRACLALPAANEVNDFYFVTLVHHGRVVMHPLQDDAVVFDRDTPPVNVEPVEEHTDRERLGEPMDVTVQQDLQQFLPSNQQISVTRSRRRVKVNRLRRRGLGRFASSQKSGSGRSSGTSVPGFFHRPCVATSREPALRISAAYRGNHRRGLPSARAARRSHIKIEVSRPAVDQPCVDSLHASLDAALVTTWDGDAIGSN